MLLGGSVVGEYRSAQAWAEAAAAMGYASSACPLPPHAGREEAMALVRAAKEHGVAIGEVGVWKNTLSVDDIERADSMLFAKEQLALAEKT